MSRVSDRAAAIVIARPGFRPLPGFLQCSLLEQSVAEPLAKVGIATVFLWLAIWWALS